MPRFFNTAGPCHPTDHYMLPAEQRVAGLRRLIEQKLYFVVHAPRQTGKTTALRTLAESLTAEGRYAALLTSCEVGQRVAPDLESSMDSILSLLVQNAHDALAPELRPPAPDPKQPPGTRFQDLLIRWARASPLPIVLFLDEIDALYDDALISLLRQLRARYDQRPEGFPQSIALIGLRNVRDYRVLPHGDVNSLGTASPFNVKSDSFRLRNFTPEEVAELYEQHTGATGQVFTEDAKRQAFDLTGGQPWLVNALARQLTETLVSDRDVEIDTPHVHLAKEILIRRRDTHLDSLMDRLREDRIRRVLQPILAGRYPEDDILDDDVQFAKDLGLIASRPTGGMAIANPIYREIIPRALTSVTEEFLPIHQASFVDDQGHLQWPQLLDGFMAFWQENAEWMLARQKAYPEAAAQLVLMAFLQKIVNGNPEKITKFTRFPTIDREFAVGSGRVDLLIRWPLATGEVERFAVEIKVRRQGEADPLIAGLEQLEGYLDRLDLEAGTLAIFDQRDNAPPLPERCSRRERLHNGRKIAVLRL
ncbi:MAG: AAA family ATPase [Acidobacteriota bacterium]